MNVFVLSTGRCGSMTFARACSHITNYSSAHESRNRRYGPDRLKYPESHIESDNRLSWFLGRLDQEYGDEAFYVHLKRDPQDTAKSFSRRLAPGLILPAYGHGIYLELPDNLETIANDLAIDYVATVNTNIELFLKHKSKTLTFQLENWPDHFPEFWARIGAQGNYDAAVSEFCIKHNASAVADAKPQTIDALRLVAGSRFGKKLLEFARRSIAPGRKNR